MDELDLSILAALQTNGRRPFTEIAQKLGVSEGTIRNRVAKLIEEDVLTINGIVNPASLGLTTPAVIGVAITAVEIEDIATQIANFDEVSYLVMVSGEFDLIVEVVCQDREHLADFINQKLRRIPGVGRTQTFITLKTFKKTFGSPPISITAADDSD